MSAFALDLPKTGLVMVVFEIRLDDDVIIVDGNDVGLTFGAVPHGAAPSCLHSDRPVFGKPVATEVHQQSSFFSHLHH